MPTALGNLSGDLSDIVDADFAKALVTIRANTGYVVDPDNDKIRVLEPEKITANIDGTFLFSNLIAAADTIVPSTLQYYLDIKVKGADAQTFGPFVIAGGDQDVSDMEVVAPVEFNSTVPIDIDPDVLAAAEAYADSVEAAHEAATNPHTQYVRMTDVSGNVVTVRFMRAFEVDPMPGVVLGAYLWKGGF